MNKLFVSGNVTKDPEFNGAAEKSVASFTVAVNENKDDTMFLNAVCFGKLAEVVNEYIVKGTKVCIEGRLNISYYTDKKDVKRSNTRVYVDRIDFFNKVVKE